MGIGDVDSAETRRSSAGRSPSTRVREWWSASCRQASASSTRLRISSCPCASIPATLTLGGFNYEGLARLAPGVTVEQASTDIARMLPIWVEAWPSFPGIDRSAFGQITPLVRPLKQELVGNVGNMLWVLMGTIGIVLVIACANVANLVLVRAQDRQHELAIRAALGAGRGRLARQLLVESLVLGLLGGALGLLLAFAGLRVLSTIGAASIPRLHEITLDPTVLVFTLVLSLSSALLFGSIPVAKFGGRRLALTLRAGGRGSSDSRERNRARNILVVVQVALALILLVGSGLMVRTFLALRAVPPGFTDPGHVQLVRVTISEAQIADPERVLRLQRDMLERLATIPGVTDVSFTGNVPMAGERSRSSIYREDAPSATSARRHRFAGSGSSRRASSRPSAHASSRAATSRGSTSRAAGPSPSSPRTWRASCGASHEPRSARGFAKATEAPGVRSWEWSPTSTTMACTARRRRSSIGRRSWKPFWASRSTCVERSPLR